MQALFTSWTFKGCSHSLSTVTFSYSLALEGETFGGGGEPCPPMNCSHGGAPRPVDRESKSGCLKPNSVKLAEAPDFPS